MRRAWCHVQQKVVEETYEDYDRRMARIEREQEYQDRRRMADPDRLSSGPTLCHGPRIPDADLVNTLIARGLLRRGI